ncbi:PQQ-binding-like beta-propeller repeat protein [Maribellus sediminis]|uniref:outer membrane protein assembly factor BamB family protein n=1 Tax=Maribellus sediminis TaxID=2696285 RepID=UPI0014311E2E|nr:PQQ-binding-like beta-propeller repeat protein [Maribellus sediminis]
MKRTQKTLLLLLISSLGAGFLYSCATKSRSEIAEWRGPNRSGIYNEDNLLDEWPEEGPELLWVFEGLGKGFAAPSILNDRIFVNGEKDSSSFLFALDLEGNMLWKAPNGREFMGEGFSSSYPGARSTPTVIGDLVYATSGNGRIACFESATGNEKWAVDVLQDFNSNVPYFGYTESVVVNNDKVYCFAGGPKTNMAALNRFTGETVWSSEAMKDTFSYCSPILVPLESGNALVTHSRHNLYAVACSTGETMGSYFLEGFEYDGEHCNSPVYSDGFIYFIGNDETGCGAVKLQLSDDGKSLNEVWSNKTIKNNFNGYVKVGNRLFTTVKGNWLKALDIENGNVADSVKVATGSIISADNKLICYGMNGDVNLVTYSENTFDISGKFKIKNGTGEHFSYPVLANGILFIRHGDALMAYKIS